MLQKRKKTNWFHHIRVICFVLLPIVACPLVHRGYAEDNKPDKTVSLRHSWIDLNYFDKKEFAAQVQNNKIDIYGARIAVSDKLSEYVFKDSDLQNWHDNMFHGYTNEELTQGGHILIGEVVLTPIFCAASFNVDIKEWKERFEENTLVIDTRKNDDLAGFFVAFHGFSSVEKARNNIREALSAKRLMVEGRDEPLIASYKNPYYRLAKGPGDICWVQLKGKKSGEFLDLDCFDSLFLSDTHMIFIRGNMMVYLQSFYSDFGCFDLACKVDAWLVKQMKKNN